MAHELRIRLEQDGVKVEFIEGIWSRLLVEGAFKATLLRLPEHIATIRKEQENERAGTESGRRRGKAHG